MLQFLYKLQPTRSEMLRDGHTEQEAQAIGQHFAYLQKLCAEGIVLLAGRTQTSDKDSFGIVILRAETQEQALAITNNDPAVQQGVMRAELYPYRIALLAPNWTL